MSESRLQVLLVEDSPSDARLLLHELRQSGFDVVATRVDTEAEYLAQLLQSPDVVLCDYSMPQFDAMRALALLREHRSEIPFLIVSGSIGEEAAIVAIKQGANDYLLKDRLARLGPAVRQALEDRKLRDADRRNREALRASEAQYRMLADSIPQLVWTARPNGDLDYLNRQALDYFGLGGEFLSGYEWERHVHPDELPRMLASWGDVLRTGESHEHEFRLRRADGVYRWHLNRQVGIRNEAGAIVRWFGTCTDIDDRKAVALRLAQDALLLANVRDSVIVTDLDGIVTYWNEGATRLFGWTAREMLGRPYAERFPEPARTVIAEHIGKRIDGTEWNGEFEDYRKDGSRVWIDARVARITDASDQPVGVMGVSHDITDRKRAEAEIQASAVFTHAVLDSMTAHIAVLERTGKIVAVNHSWRTFLVANSGPMGLAARSSVGANYLEVCDLSAADGCTDAFVVAAGIREVLAGSTNRLTLEYPCHSPDEHRWFLLSVTPLGVGGAVVAHIDITPRKEAEELLRSERDRFTTIAAIAPGVIYSFRQSLEGTFSVPYASPAVADIFGLPSDPLEENATAIFGQIHADDADRVRSAIAESARLMRSFRETFRIRRHAGEEIWIECHSRPDREVDGGILWHGFLTDVTDRKREEKLLRYQHALLEGQSEASPDGILVVSPDNRVLSYNRRFLDLWGIPEKLAAAGDDTPILKLGQRLAADPVAFVSRIAAIYAEPEMRSEDEVVLADGRTLERYSGPIRAVGGESLGRIWFFRDITDRKRSEALFGAVMRSVSDAIVTIDEKGVIGSVNPAVERHFGYRVDELVGLKVEVLIPDLNRDQHDGFIRDYLRTGESRIIGKVREVICRRKDGTTFPADLSVSEFRLDESRYFTGVVRDVTARKKLEEQYRQAQKMEAFGQLAGGVAHDFNNLLTVINGYSDLLLTGFPATDRRREPLAAVRDAGERAAGLTAQLLAFSRKTILSPKILDLNEVVDSIAKMLRRLIGEDVNLIVILSPTLSRVKADPGQIQQVLMNLAVNARDAMPNGGRLTIETADHVLGAEAAQFYPGCSPGRYVRMIVSDTGMGMKDEVREKIFEPFFTTKGVGKGTGLGLATVYGIVTQSEGYIRVSSEVGRGATFDVILPAIADARTSPGGNGNVEPVRGNETILLVEDEDGVRRIARISLEIQGYKVLEADGGPEAIEVAERHPGPIHLLVTDVVMPMMGGRAVVDALRIRRPDILVLYMSGYTDDAVVRHGVSEEAGAFLQKPFTPVSLARKVRAVLDRSE